MTKEDEPCRIIGIIHAAVGVQTRTIKIVRIGNAIDVNRPVGFLSGQVGLPD
jgi:hypothetical protein